MKVYREIQAVVMANDNDLECVTFESLPKLSEMSYWDGYLDLSEMLFTKLEVLSSADHIIVSGFGKWAGRPLWHLPESIIVQIKKTFIKKDLKK
tara:strand:- start:638 stop:919 length:282 start_codon:yes stop_codon:yes gene_type:complete